MEALWCMDKDNNPVATRIVKTGRLYLTLEHGVKVERINLRSVALYGRSKQFFKSAEECTVAFDRSRLWHNLKQRMSNVHQVPDSVETETIKALWRQLGAIV